MVETMHRDYAALVGWTAEVAGDRMTLRLQGVTKPPPHQPGDVHSQYYSWIGSRRCGWPITCSRC